MSLLTRSILGDFIMTPSQIFGEKSFTFYHSDCNVIVTRLVIRRRRARKAEILINGFVFYMLTGNYLITHYLR
jgi:hypothetical protein